MKKNIEFFPQSKPIFSFQERLSPPWSCSVGCRASRTLCPRSVYTLVASDYGRIRLLHHHFKRKGDNKQTISVKVSFAMLLTAQGTERLMSVSGGGKTNSSDLKALFEQVESNRAEKSRLLSLDTSNAHSVNVLDDQG